MYRTSLLIPGSARRRPANEPTWLMPGFHRVNFGRSSAEAEQLADHREREGAGEMREQIDAAGAAGALLGEPVGAARRRSLRAEAAGRRRSAAGTPARPGCGAGGDPARRG